MPSFASASSPLGPSIETSEIVDGNVTMVKLATDLNIGGSQSLKLSNYLAIQGAWTFAVNSNNRYASRANTGNTTADTHYLEYNVYLAKGTYTMFGSFIRGTARGKCHVDIDGVDVGSIDTYGSSSEDQSGSITGITVATTGLKTIRLSNETKHASASNYEIVISGLWEFVRTA